MAQKPMEEQALEETARLFMRYLFEKDVGLQEGSTLQRESMRSVYTNTYKPRYKDNHPGKTLANFSLIFKVST